MSTRSRLFSALALVVALLAMSCAPSSGPASTPTQPPPTTKPAGAPSVTPAATTTAQQPRSGGILNMIRWDDLTTFDVQQETSFNVQGMLLSCYSGLVQNDPANPEKIAADAAEKWDWSADGKTLTFTMRKGITFHDGKPLTTEDVKISLDRLWNPPKGVLSPRQSTLTAISSVEAQDNAVRVNLKYPSASLLPMLAVGQIVIFPKHILDAKGNMKRDVVGTGPFKFKDYDPGSFLEVVRNPNYFISQRPYLDGIKFFIIKDAGTRLAAFRTGRVKLYGGGGPGPSPAQSETITREVPGARVIQFPGLTYRALLFNAKESPWNDVRLRRAASLALDRQAAVKSLTQGTGDIGAFFVPGTQWAIPKDELLKQPGYRQPKDADIAEAKKLMADAGFPSGLKTKLLASSALTQDLGVFLVDQLAKINITAELDVQEHGIFTDRMVKKNFTLIAQPPGMRSADPVEVGRYLVSGCLYCGALEDKKIDDMFDQVDRALDPVQRAKITVDIDRYLLEVVPAAVAYHGKELVAVAPEVKDYNPGFGWYNNHKYQDVWLAK